MKIGRILVTVMMLTLLASSAHAYTWDQIDLVGTYGTGDNTALFVVDFSDASGDSFAWEINFSTATITDLGILYILFKGDPDFTAVVQGAFIMSITYGAYSGSYQPPYDDSWFKYSSANLGESWSRGDSDLGITVGDGGTIGLLFDQISNPGYPETPVSSSVPIPGAVWLLGSGLVGLVGLRRKQKSR